ncbi:hypothetical protein Tco_0519271 [Tanacetum coccineum]
MRYLRGSMGSTLGADKALMNVKVDEPKLSDISVVRDFIHVFQKICSNDHRNESESRRLCSWRTPVAKVSISSRTSEMQNIFDTTFQEFDDKVIFCEEHQCRLLRKRAWSSFEVSFGITEEGEVYGVRGMKLAAQSEAFKQENVPLVGSEMDEAHASSLRYLSENEKESPWILSLNFQDQSNNSKEWNSGDDQLRLRWMIYLVVLADAAESVRDTIGFEYCLASSSGWTKSPVLWAEIGESSLTGPELVLDTTDKVVLIKEKLKAARDRQKSYADKRRKPLEFEILERIGPVAYRLRLPEELSSVHDTFHVSNLKKCLADANLHVPLNEIKIDKTLRFVEELVEIMDREIRNLKRSKIPLVKVHWNSKRGPEFTWEREDHMKSKYPQLFVDRAVESAS